MTNLLESRSSLSSIDPLWDKTRSFWDIKNSLSHERGSERSEWAVRANELTDEWVAQYLRLYSCLIQTTVRSPVFFEAQTFERKTADYGNITLWDKARSIWHIKACTFPRAREWVSEWANKWAQWSARTKRAVRSKRMSEQCERTSEQTSKWPSTCVPILGCSEPLCTR